MIDLSASGRLCKTSKFRMGESLPMPDSLLKTVVMMVRPRVPPNGSVTAMSEMTVAMLLRKMPMMCS